MSDLKLWNELRSGSHKALETIYNQYFGNLYNYGRKFCADAATVEDCIHELFVEIWNRRDKLSETNAIQPYLYVALKRKIFAQLKKDAKITQSEFEESQFDANLTIEQIMVDADHSDEMKTKLAAAFDHLSSRQKQILYLKYYSNMDYEGIGETMDLNYQSARNLVARALQKLSKSFISILILLFSL